MEKENIERAKFNTQYLGQKVLVVANDYKGNPVVNELMEVNTFCDKDPRFYLLLRSISQLTDEECEHIAKLIHLKGDNYFKEHIGEGNTRITHVRKGLLNDNLLTMCDMSDCIAVIDYLRSIGILIPFMGMSVQEILDRGFAKIKED